jgi:shikimate kinase
VSDNIEKSVMSKTIFLMGFMGSGKSAVARSLARRLRWPVIDLDGLIETRIRCSIARYFATYGEAKFREIESEILASVADKEGVVSLGGGVPTQLVNRDLLKQAGAAGSLVIYLRAGPDILAERIRRQPGKRPLIDGDGELDMEATRQRVVALLKQREPFYMECANNVIETDNLTIPSVCREILSRMDNI